MQKRQISHSANNFWHLELQQSGSMEELCISEVTRLRDLYDEHRLHVKYHIIAVTAAAYPYTFSVIAAMDVAVCTRGLLFPTYVWRQ